LSKNDWLIFWAAAAAVAYWIWLDNSAGPSTATAVGNLTTSQAGQDMIKAEEAPGGVAVLTAYPDAGGYSIGWGHYGVAAGTTISYDQAVAYFESDLAAAEQRVKSAITVPLTQDQFDALVDLAFNLKSWPTGAQTIIGAVNAGNWQKAIASFALYVRSQGVVLKGLVTRRAADAALFAAGSDSGSSGAGTSNQESDGNGDDQTDGGTGNGGGGDDGGYGFVGDDGGDDADEE